MKISNNTTVIMDYRLTDSDGALLETTEAEGPVSYIHGSGMMLPELEKQLEGLEAGASVKVELKCGDAFGERLDELVMEIPIEEFDDPDNLEVGGDIILENGEEEVLMTVVEVEDGKVTLDGNHPFAGSDIVFSIEVREVRAATDEDRKELLDGDHDHDCEGGCCGNCCC